MKILIVDDEEDILEFLSYNLKKQEYKIFTANDGNKGLMLAQKHNPDLIILDVMMPGMDGIELCDRIRQVPALNDVLIIFLTARAEDYSELAGFDAGADDYITKPIKPKLLISRIKAILRRKTEKLAKNIKLANFEIDKDKYTLFYSGKEIFLAKKEFNLLFYLMTLPGKVFKRKEIIEEVWNDAIVGDRTIDVHIRKIREKIGDHHIKTVKGVGYKFDV
ncbi:MAG: DNA-binding response regulator [Flavobacteriales bacterium TMED123]|nr:MAG: DNA-binding response regulator [Flavobacteriales bacterium TMED123]|tara:strand:+ start:438 stop:1097 length:660 start_codon:yes stop_codon:yes gene_type:complete